MLVTRLSLSIFVALTAIFRVLGTASEASEPSTPIKHVVFVIQENRSFDNLFHGLSGANYSDAGLTHTGDVIPLRATSFLAKFDLSNGYQDFTKSFDNGRMDGYDLRRAGAGPGAVGKRLHLPFASYAYLPRSEVLPYFELARQYVVGDRMFQSNIDQSFSAHLFLIAGQAAHTANVPTRKPWGCDGGPHNSVTVLDRKRRAAGTVFPCFSFPTLADRLQRAHLSWRYYAPRTDTSTSWDVFARSHAIGYPSRSKRQPDFGQLWSAFDAIAPVRYGPEWNNDVVSPETKILRDARSGDLPAVSWVVPDWRNSDHSLSLSKTGPDWVASIINAIGSGPRWSDTVVLITWDDSGGWYDHVPPPQLDRDGLGVRVPLIVVSAYAKRGVISHTRYEFGSLLKFAEQTFGLSPLSASDRRANSILDCLNFATPPRPFAQIHTSKTIKQFEAEKPSNVAPDND